MCDCYGHKCWVCDTTVPMHIGDFKYPREYFQVWCARHVQDAPDDAIVFIGDRSRFRCAIAGPEVGAEGDNLPNVEYDLKEMTAAKYRRRPSRARRKKSTP